MAKEKLTVEGLTIAIDKNGYICITDIAKKSTDQKPAEVIRNWIRNTDTINFLEIWETVHNSNFKVGEMAYFRKLAANRTLRIGPKTLVEQTNAIGMTSKSGRYGGTYAHSDIALNFCYWLSPEFQVYFLKEFQRLKNDEAARLGQHFDLRRELTKTNYSLQTDAIKAMLIPDKIKGTRAASPFYSNEADLLNVVVFGDTAKGWKSRNPTLKGNMRDHATIEELILLLNMEVLNATMIHWEWSQEMRIEVLQKESKRQMPTILKSAAMKRIKSDDKK